MVRITELPIELIENIITPLRTSEDYKTMRALAQASWLFRELLVPILFSKLVINFHRPSITCVILKSLSSPESLTRRAASLYAKTVDIRLANLIPLEEQIRELWPPSRARTANQKKKYDFAGRRGEIAIYHEFLRPALLSLQTCEIFKICTAPHTPNSEEYTPAWAAEIIADVLAGLANLRDLEIRFPNQATNKPLIREGTCLGLRRFCLILPDYLNSTEVRANDVPVIVETIDTAIAGKPVLETLEIWGQVFLCPDHDTILFVGPIFGGPLLSNSPPLKLKTLKLDYPSLQNDSFPVSAAIPHLQELECLHINNVTRVNGETLQESFCHMLTTNKTHLRSLILPCYNVYSHVEHRALANYLASYTGLEELSISTPNCLRGNTALKAHSSTLRRLSIARALSSDISFLFEAHNLEELKITIGPERIEPYSILDSINRFPNLQCLWIAAPGLGDWPEPNPFSWIHHETEIRSSIIRGVTETLSTTELPFNHPLQRVCLHALRWKRDRACEFRRAGNRMVAGWVDKRGRWKPRQDGVATFVTKWTVIDDIVPWASTPPSNRSFCGLKIA